MPTPAFRLTPAGASLLLAIALPAAAQDAPLTQAQTEFFETSIRPVLVEYCYDCHSRDADRVRGEFLLDTREAIRSGGPSGPGVVPGDPDGSLVIQAIRGDSDDLIMPPRDELPAQAVADLLRWVEMGAPDPRVPKDPGEAEALWTREIDYEAARAFWAFVPPDDSGSPQVTRTNWPETDIDRYVLAKMEEQGLAPVRDADRASLLRRLSFDLIGLPPTPEQVESFTKDGSRGALARIVDELLASPHFGERWGRHWLDVARYAESSGKESNILYPHAWRYRDYVIDSFNHDKPYDAFLIEQLAGDLLPARDDDERAEHMIATGYLAIGSKGHNTRSRPQFAVDLADEQIDAVTQGMLGITVACARCHDHKFDPIPTTDYYAMAGIFLSTETCYGTQQTGGNRHGSPLLDLPGGADVEPGTPLPPNALQALNRRLGQVTAERDRLQEEVQQAGGARNNQQAAARLRNVRNQVTTIEQVLARYDENGRPSEASLVTMGVRERRRPADARVLVRGELEKAGDRVPRGFLTVLENEDDPVIRRGSGRRELAQWITSESNPLTARVWANRVWSYLLGEPLVPTPDNFGASGVPPTHPELLDHLAIRLVENDWSTKALIREIVLSRVYRLGPGNNARNHAIDPDNIYLWRAPLKRLEAEAIRDAMLAVSGTLQTEPPGGSAASLSEGRAQSVQRYTTVAANQPIRSVYLPVLRDLVPESLSVFDFAETSFVTGERDETNVPSQALYLMNDPVVMACAEAFASRLLSMEGTDQERVHAAFVLAFGRPPSGTEMRAVRSFFEDFAPAQAQNPPESDRAQRARQRRQRLQRGGSAREDYRLLSWTAFCQSLFASAEFRYLS